MDGASACHTFMRSARHVVHPHCRGADEREQRKDYVGPLEPPKADIRQEPYTLPEGFIWDTVDVLDDAQLEDLYQLLNENYVEDGDAMFRFDYSKEFLRWYVPVPVLVLQVGSVQGIVWI
jgi:hypothetical protein